MLFRSEELNSRRSVLKKLEAGKPAEHQMYLDYWLGRKSNNEMRDQIALMGANIQQQTLAFRQQMGLATIKQQAYEKERNQTKDTLTLLANVEALNLDKETENSAKKLALQDLASKGKISATKSTPHDAGVFNIVKEPRGDITFDTAFNYWQDQNIDDPAMWKDWNVELSSMGYSFVGNKIVPPQKSDPLGIR